MSTTLKSLQLALANAGKRSDDCLDLFEDFLSRYYVVNGNPDEEWIVGSSCALDDYRRYFCREYGSFYDTLAGVNPFTSPTQIWAKTHGLCPWWRNATAEALPYIKAIETALCKYTEAYDYIFDMVEDLEEALGDYWEEEWDE